MNEPPNSAAANTRDKRKNINIRGACSNVAISLKSLQQTTALQRHSHKVSGIQVPHHCPSQYGAQYASHRWLMLAVKPSSVTCKDIVMRSTMALGNPVHSTPREGG